MYYMEKNGNFKLKRFLIQDGGIYKMRNDDTPDTVDKSDDYAEKFKARPDRDPSILEHPAKELEEIINNNKQKENNY